MPIPHWRADRFEPGDHGLDTQLIDDGTYFVVEQDGLVAGCGGWSRRATLYGGDRSPGCDAAPLDPAKDAARVRAMYTHPSFTRRGVGRLILAPCEAAARTEGFTCVELMATMAGEPLYRACGYDAIEEVVDERGGVGVPLLRMKKVLWMIGKLGILIAGGRGDISSACFSHGRADRSENFVVDGDLD